MVNHVPALITVSAVASLTMPANHFVILKLFNSDTANGAPYLTDTACILSFVYLLAALPIMLRSLTYLHSIRCGASVSGALPVSCFRPVRVAGLSALPDVSGYSPRIQFPRFGASGFALPVSGFRSPSPRRGWAVVPVSGSVARPVAACGYHVVSGLIAGGLSPRLLWRERKRSR